MKPKSMNSLENIKFPDETFDQIREETKKKMTSRKKTEFPLSMRPF